ncbi:hypothetical protein [Lederbergia citrea]|uniref:Uncharacterized protein n=1 Tax=Lederbergia citrea TaxID=2833581 RepID=A0A942UJT3_9BACI|nr:hypothetical protein [Lederbergia citrea]MBS4176002.1 hypothetical protein [Lederbergia citrea]MBS4202563.1 hypothetical protein [Lederbergia citrea]MBS4222771.1 hypothetical protein [Lederbergia citrea]
MYRSKGFLFLLSIVGIFLLVYGTSVILYLLSGNYLLDGGLTDPNYVFLALSCSAPFVLYLLFSRRHSARALEVILTSGLLFVVLFIPAHFSLVLDGVEKSQNLLFRLITILPVYALLLLCISHVMLRRK